MAGFGSDMPVDQSEDQPQWRSWANCHLGVISPCSQEWTASPDDYGATAFSHDLPPTGQHYIAVELSHTPCCCHLGLVPSDMQEMDGPSQHMATLMSFRNGDDPQWQSTAGTREPYNQPLTVGVLVDMDAKVVHFFPHGRFCFGAKVMSSAELPRRVKFAVYHGKHGLSAKLIPNPQLPLSQTKSALLAALMRASPLLSPLLLVGSFWQRRRS